MLKSPPTLEELRAHRDKILRLVEKYGASNVRVVGSVARQEASPSSDVDFLMTIPLQSVFDLVGLWLDLQALLGCPVSIIPDTHVDEQFLASVLEDAVPL
ncbi:MAG: nucleotidyltransferase [Chloroflexi bacterium]|nr:MAG: nucleotidyltransferase [Chloroflexota bacterium]